MNKYDMYQQVLSTLQDMYDMTEAENEQTHLAAAKEQIETASRFYKTIQVGNIVKVIDTGEVYSTYTGWFEDNNIDRDLCCLYDYNNSPDLMDGPFKVLAIHPHSTNSDNIALIQENKTNGRTYLIGIEGIRRVK